MKVDVAKFPSVPEQVTVTMTIKEARALHEAMETCYQCDVIDVMDPKPSDTFNTLYRTLGRVTK